MTSNISDWGVTSDGRKAQRVTLNNNGMSAAIITFGASLQDLRLEQHDAPLVLGFDDLESYEKHGLYFGAIAGRCANRIANGRFELAGEKYELAKSEGELHHLHGGPNGFATRIWKVVESTDFQVVLELESQDGEMGYPGNLVARCSYSLDAHGGLNIELEAEANAPTICNLTNHAYFNLEDGGGNDVNLHRLRIDAEEACALTESLVPTGALSLVSGTENDFRAIRPIGDYHAYDLNFCLGRDRRELTDVARLIAPSSGVQMDVATTEPGIQLFTALNPASVRRGLEGIEYAAGAGLCLEAQIWPDAINHSHFPNVILMPGQRLRQVTQYRFSMVN